MIGSIGSTLSAIVGFGKKLNVTGNNIANVNTDNFKKSRVTFAENSAGGISPKVDQISTEGYPKTVYRNGNELQSESSNVDLAESIPNLITAETGYSANVKMAKVKDAMTGSMFDLFS